MTKYIDFRGEASGFTADIMDDHSKDAKGQLISKCLFGVFNFSQKTNDEIQLYCYDTTGRLVFVRILREIEDTKKTFRN